MKLPFTMVNAATLAFKKFIGEVKKGTTEELAIAILEAVFNWQPIETAPQIKNQPILIYWRECVKHTAPKKYRFFVAEGMWDDGGADDAPQDFDYEDAAWVLPTSDGFEEPIKWLP